MDGDCVKHDENHDCAYLKEECVFLCGLCKKECVFIDMYTFFDGKKEPIVCEECYKKESGEILLEMSEPPPLKTNLEKRLDFQSELITTLQKAVLHIKKKRVEDVGMIVGLEARLASLEKIPLDSIEEPSNE